MTTGDRPSPNLREIPSGKVLFGCGLAAALLWILGLLVTIPRWVLALEVFATVISLFVFGSIRFRVNKNAVAYGAMAIIVATFWQGWWDSSALRRDLSARGGGALWDFIRRHFLTLEGLDRLVHADTMLFILGLTFFVAVIGQTRLLESFSFFLLRKGRGAVASTIGLIAALVAVASGILDGVSMIGLLIRTMVIILIMAKAARESVVFAVMVSTAVTTVCGMWLAYGEPPNLIMKANLHPHLTDSFFLRYCLPGAVGSYLIVMWNVRRRLRGIRIDPAELDILDVHTADVRFLQAARHGKVLTASEFVESHRDDLGPKAQDVLDRIREGGPLGRALAASGVPEAQRRLLIGKFVAEDLADALDEHYAESLKGAETEDRRDRFRTFFRPAAAQRKRAQGIGSLAFIPFVGLLAWHAIDHRVPLFFSSMAAFAIALLGIVRIGPMRSLALREGRHEYAEYLFLLPLFLSITLLQKTGFFDNVAALIRSGVTVLGQSHVAFLQLAGATVLSAILDNNVVADFAGRAIKGLGSGLVALFSMAQIAGYAVGGCWSHIGSAQSVVAYSFIQRELDSGFTPFQWIKIMTPIVLEIFVLMAVLVYAEGFLLSRG